MSNRQKLLFAGGLVFVFLVIQFYSMPPPATGVNSNEISSSAKELEKTIPLANHGQDAEQKPLDAFANPSATFSTAAKLCFPELVGDTTLANDFIKDWKSLHSQALERIDYIHYFYKDKSGQEWRAQVLYNYPNGRPTRELKLYKVLEDGLPDPVQIDAKEKSNPSDTVLANYINFDSVFETQKKWSLDDGKGAQIEVEESNSQIIEFQLFQDGKIFRCHDGDCECKK